MKEHLLNTYGALFMAISWGIVIGLNIFSFYKILYNNRKNKTED
ncbi:hypothetical protein [Persephonella sp. IF05-L8]